MHENIEKLLPGKLPHALLSRLLEKYTTRDKHLILGAQAGEDAAVIDAGDRYLLLKTDPITFVTDDMGYYVVHVNANDIVCMGGQPKWFLVSILLSGNITSSSVSSLFRQISTTCKKENICYCGGHTEITAGLDRTIVVGAMLGEADKDKLLLKSNIQSEDHIILIKEIPIEATSIIAREKSEELAKVFSLDFVKRCQHVLYLPGISVRNEARIALQAGPVHALHDPTEGGIATALHELAMASHLGFTVFFDQIPFLPEGQFLCDQYNLNPLGCISSGSLLAIVPPRAVNPVLTHLHNEGIAAADIGIMNKDENRKILTVGNQELTMPIFHQDEVIKIL